MVLTVHPFDPACSGESVVFFSVPISTNAAGNGHASTRVVPSQAAGLAGSHGANWIVMDGETAVYQTGCQKVDLD